MLIENVKYLKYKGEGDNIGIMADIDSIGTHIPLDPANRHYAAILEWAKIDGNTIEEAD
jgi:hypothetical protein